MQSSPAAPLPRAGRVAIVVSRYNESVTSRLLDGARRCLSEQGVPDQAVDVFWVPGAFELPVVAKALAQQGHHAVICVGLVLRGGTPHFEHVCRAVTDGCTQVAVATGVPVGFGVLTCDSLEQAVDRSGLPGSREDKGREAALAAVETALLLRELRHGGHGGGPARGAW
jgi:6,7-dimethyl-8-ribityllumazine synthase